MLLAITYFSIMNLCVKGLKHLPVMELVFIRCSLSLVFCYIWLKRLGIPWRGKKENLPRLWGRAIAGSLALYLFFLTIQNMPLATAVTVQYLNPIFAAILAVFLLKEKLKPVQLLYFLISFIGIIMLKGFDDRVSWPYLLAGVASAFLAGFAYNIIRNLKGREHALVIVLYLQIAGTIMSGGFMLFQFTMPQGWDWFWLFCVGFTAFIAHYYMTKALQGGRVGIISSINFLGAIYVGIFAWIIFGESLTLWNIIAMGIVILGVFLNIRENN